MAGQAEKASAYKLELERTWRRIAGVDGVRIEGRTVQIDFADHKPISDLKKFGRQIAGSACLFPQDHQASKQVSPGSRPVHHTGAAVAGRACQKP